MYLTPFRRFFVLSVLWGAGFVGGGGLPGGPGAARAGQADVPGPQGSAKFGSVVKALPNGNFVVVDEDYTPPELNIRTGAVFVYSREGVLISRLTGSKADDRVGCGGVTVLANGNFVIRSYRWDNGDMVDAGAVTWGSMTAGVSGVISPQNSLVGSLKSDFAGDSALNRGAGGVIALSNGNYVVVSPTWDNGVKVRDAGAVTWADGTTGISGVITAANSLVGGAPSDLAGQILQGGGVTEVGGGNYVVCSPYWRNGNVPNAGAVTWCSGTTGRAGLITPDNSLVGSHERDWLGAKQHGPGVVVLTNGNYVVSGESWDRGTTADAGSATWCSGLTGRTGPVSESNSLVGRKAGDRVSLNGSGGDRLGGVVALKNGNYVVTSPGWSNGALTSAGAVTWGNGTTGTAGEVTPENSVTGSTIYDGIGRVLALASGGYAVCAPRWDSGSLTDVGAVRVLGGDGPSSGFLTQANSLTGRIAGDQVGGGSLTALTNGNFVVASPLWRKDSTSVTGAVTWVNAGAPLTGPVTPENSLTGSVEGGPVGGSPTGDADYYGGVTALTDGNFVIVSSRWKKPAAGAVGAVTWADGTQPLTGTVTAENSLTGGAAGDYAGGGTDPVNSGGITPLPGGHFLISSPSLKNPLPAGLGTGAVTWCAGGGPVTGIISAANSLVPDGVTHWLRGAMPVVLPGGEVAVPNPGGFFGSASSAGTMSLIQSSQPTVGLVDSTNSVFGETNSGGALMTFDWDAPAARLLVGRPLDNRVTIFSRNMPDLPKLRVELANGATVEEGGTVDMDQVNPGAVRVRHVVVRNSGYADLVLTSASASDAQVSLVLPGGGVTLAHGESVTLPVIFNGTQAGNQSAVIRLISNDPVTPELSFTVRAPVAASRSFSTDIPAPEGSGAFGAQVAFLPNGNLVVTDPDYDAPGAVPVQDAGAVYLYSAAGAQISRLTGSTANDRVGSGGVTVLANGNFVITSGGWSREGEAAAGAVTWADGSTGVSGVVSAENSLVGRQAGDRAGTETTNTGEAVPCVFPLPGGHYVVRSPLWNGMAGAVTWGNGLTGVKGVIGPENSLTGSAAGSGGITVLANGNYVIASDGAVTLGPWGSALTGTVSESNSLVAPAATAGNRMLTVKTLSDGNYLAHFRNYLFEGDAPVNFGALIWCDGITPRTGPLRQEDTLRGTGFGNFGQLMDLGQGKYAVANSLWNGNRGAVTWCAAGGGTRGVVSEANSLTGSREGDYVGENVVLLANGNPVVVSSRWNGRAGAVTWVNADAPLTGPVTGTNSLIGSNADFGTAVGSGGVTALEDGNYVVVSPSWKASISKESGAVTWCDGTKGRTGPVTAGISLVCPGISANAVTALTGDRYVVCSPRWRDADYIDRGAVTWLSGTTEGAGAIDAGNSLIGSPSIVNSLIGLYGDYVGSGGVVPLANGNYLIRSPLWWLRWGAVTWVDGSRPLSGYVSSTNSLQGITDHTLLSGGGSGLPQPQSGGVFPLKNGHYLVGSSPYGGRSDAGALTWGDGRQGVFGTVSSRNSLVGSAFGDQVGGMKPEVYADSAYAMLCPNLDRNGTAQSGGVIFGGGRADTAATGTLNTSCSVLGEMKNQGSRINYSRDTPRLRWAVGRPGDNVVTLFSYPAPGIPQIYVESSLSGADLTDAGSLDFGFAEPGNWTDRSLAVTNTGGEPLHLGAISFSDPRFTMTSAPALTTLPPGGRTEMRLRFTPSSAGLKTGTLRLESDDPDKPALSVNLRGIGRPSAARPFGEEIISPEITALPDGGTSVRFHAVPGITYLLERSQDLKTWAFSRQVTADETGTILFTDSEPRAAAGFYRLKAR